MAPGSENPGRTSSMATPQKKHAEHDLIQLVTPQSLGTLPERAPVQSTTNNAEDLDKELEEENEAYVQFFRESTAILTKLMDIDRISPESFWSNLEEYSVSLATLLDRDHPSGLSIVERLIDEEGKVALEKPITRIEKYWSDAAHKDLSRHLSDLEDRVRDSPLIKDEHHFAKLGRRIRCVTGAYPSPDVNFDHDDWIRFMPICMTSDTQAMVNRLHALYDTYQQDVYLDEAVKEEFKLWYLIWMNLKKILYELSQDHWSSEGLLFPLEMKFSDHPALKTWWAFILSQLEFSCTQDIEDLVAEYCKFVHDSLRKDHQVTPTPLDEETLSVLTQFGTSLQEKQDPRLSGAVHKAVIRLNHLLGKPKVLRRLGRTVEVYLADVELSMDFAKDQEADKDILDRLMPKVPWLPKWYPITEEMFAKTAVANEFPPLIDLSEDGEGSEHIEDIENSEDTDTQIETDFSEDDGQDVQIVRSHRANIPRGQNIISAYDYVYCPVPETRAYEVANSRLISRDLRDPGIVSDGLRVEDVVNLPPLHCRTPGTWTTWKQRIPLGPYEICCLLGSSLWNRVRGSKSRSHGRPIPPPRVTTRDECRHYKHKGKHTATYDPRTRVTKPKASDRMGLRGGGPRYVPNPDVSPSRPGRAERDLGARQVVHNSQRNLIRELTDTPPQTGPSSQAAIFISAGSNVENRAPSPSGAANEGRPALADITPAVGDGGGASENDEINTDHHVTPTIEYDPDRCHPCPYYKGQFHHKCGDNCGGLVVHYMLYDDWNEAVFFEGSLWENRGSVWIRQPEVQSLEAFIDRYRWVTGAEHRNFGLSNGGKIRIYRRFPGGPLVFDTNDGPQPQWDTSRADWNDVAEESFVDELPQNLSKVQFLEQGSPDFSDIKVSRVVNIDALLSPEWKTRTYFRLYFGAFSSQSMVVELERADELPRERLIRVPEDRVVIIRHRAHSPQQSSQPVENAGLSASQRRVKSEPSSGQSQQTGAQSQSAYTHIRDYDAPDIAPDDTTALSTQPGYDQLMTFQARLKKLKEEEKQRKQAERAQQQHDQEARERPSNFATGVSAQLPNAQIPGQQQSVPQSANNVVFPALSAAEILAQLPDALQSLLAQQTRPVPAHITSSTPANQSAIAHQSTRVSADRPANVRTDSNPADSQQSSNGQQPSRSPQPRDSKLPSQKPAAASAPKDDKQPSKSPQSQVSNPPPQQSAAAPTSKDSNPIGEGKQPDKDPQSQAQGSKQPPQKPVVAPTSQNDESGEQTNPPSPKPGAKTPKKPKAPKQQPVTPAPRMRTRAATRKEEAEKKKAEEGKKAADAKAKKDKEGDGKGKGKRPANDSEDESEGEVTQSSPKKVKKSGGVAKKTPAKKAPGKK